MNNYSDLWIFVLVLFLWIVLNRWVLPWFGVSTCMSGGCAWNGRPSIREVDASAADRHQRMEGGTDNVGQPEGESHVSQDGN